MSNSIQPLFSYVGCFNCFDYLNFLCIKKECYFLYHALKTDTSSVKTLVQTSINKAENAFLANLRGSIFKIFRGECKSLIQDAPSVWLQASSLVSKSKPKKVCLQLGVLWYIPKAMLQKHMLLLLW